MNIGDRQRHRVACRGGQPSTLDLREVLAHAVELANRKARSHQRPRRRHLVLERDTVNRSGEQRRCAAGQQHDQMSAGVCRLARQFQRAPSCRNTGCVGRWMARGKCFKPRESEGHCGAGAAIKPARTLTPAFANALAIGHAALPAATTDRFDDVSSERCAGPDAFSQRSTSRDGSTASTAARRMRLA